MDRVEVIEVQPLLKGFLSVDEATVRYEKADGTMSRSTKRQCLERGDAVAVVLLNVSRDRLLFVRQFRYACLRHEDPYPIEIVAGAIDEGEKPEESARREVEEEVGYRVGDLHFAQRLYSSPGTTSEMLHVFYAEVRDEDRIHVVNLLEGEDVTLVEIAPQDVWKMLDDGRIRDAKTLVGLYWLRQRR